MSAPKRTSTALALLIPTGVIGISSALAVTQIRTMENTASNGSVSERLHEIRQAVSSTLHGQADNTVTDADGVKLMLAEWLNFGGGLGWRNGGWGNGWHNGGWGNGGWHNAANWGNGGWGNGGWHNAPNWGNGGWHNAPNWGNGGWHNFWHNA